MRSSLLHNFPVIATLDHEPTMDVIHAQIARINKYLMQPHTFFPSVHAISQYQPEGFTLPRYIDNIPTIAMLCPIPPGREKDPASKIAVQAGVRHAINTYGDLRTSIPTRQFDTLVGIAASLHVTPTKHPQILFTPTPEFRRASHPSERRLMHIASIVAACSIVPFDILKTFCAKHKIHMLTPGEQVTMLQMHKSLLSNILEYAPLDLAVILQFLSTQPSIEAAIHHA